MARTQTTGQSINQLHTMANQFLKKTTTLKKNWKSQNSGTGKSTTYGRASNMARGRGGRQAQTT